LCTYIVATMYVHNSINSNLKFGKGHGPINHLSSVTVEKKFR
jgi:hydroxymethylpyrimidine/phosphomethylpyrimidine kinase